MALKNYTTTVEALKTVAEVHRLLAAWGARQVVTEYDRGEPVGLCFVVDTAHGPRPFRLPANHRGVLAAMTRQADAGVLARRYATADQALRVSWRIVKDWLENQIALIESGHAKVEEVMLPFMLVSQDETVYQRLSRHSLALPPPDPGE